MSRTRRSTRADGELTRARILDAAGALFAATGYAETTSKSIARQAGVDLASINYHFGSRQGLYQAALVEAHRRIVSLGDLKRMAESALAPSDKLLWCMDRLIDAAIGNDGWHVRLLARELLAPSSNLQVLLEEELAPKLALIRRIVGQITGMPEDEPALTRCMISIAAPCLMLLVAGHGNIPHPVQQVLQMPHAQVRAHMHQFALAGLQAIGTQYSERALLQRNAVASQRRSRKS